MFSLDQDFDINFLFKCSGSPYTRRTLLLSNLQKRLCSGNILFILCKREKICFIFLPPALGDPGWKTFYDSLTPQSETMPDPWDVLSGLDRSVEKSYF